MNDVYLFILGLLIVEILLLIYAMAGFTSLKERLDVLERNFSESTLGCYDNEDGVEQAKAPGRDIGYP